MGKNVKGSKIFGGCNFRKGKNLHLCVAYGFGTERSEVRILSPDQKHLAKRGHGPLKGWSFSFCDVDCDGTIVSEKQIGCLLKSASMRTENALRSNGSSGGLTPKSSAAPPSRLLLRRALFVLITSPVKSTDELPLAIVD